MSYHQIEVIGNLTGDPEMKYVRETPKTSFSVAVNIRRKDNEKTFFHDVECWGPLAETVAEYKRKGDKVFVTGEPQMDEWEDNDGQKRRKWYIRASNVVFLGDSNRGGRRDDDDRGSRRRDDDRGRGNRDDRPRRAERPRDDRDDEDRRARDSERYNDLPF